MENLEKILIQNKDSTSTVNCGILVISSETVSVGTTNCEIATVKVEYDSISNQEYATSCGVPVAEKLSTTGVISPSDYIGSYITSFVGGSLSATADFLVDQIRSQNNWFAIRITNQNENSIYKIIYQVSG